MKVISGGATLQDGKVVVAPLEKPKPVEKKETVKQPNIPENKKQ